MCINKTEVALNYKIPVVYDFFQWSTLEAPFSEGS